MIRKATFLALAAMALFAVQTADCASLFSAEHQKMTCCGAMPCHSSHGAHQCCKASDSRPAPTVAAQESGAGKISSGASAILLAAANAVVADAVYSEFAAPQHSPPELYTLHSSLRI